MESLVKFYKFPLVYLNIQTRWRSTAYTKLHVLCQFVSFLYTFRMVKKTSSSFTGLTSQT